MLSHDETAIIAQCTPHGSGAIALLRLTGANAIEIATRMSKCASEKNIAQVPTHTIHFGWVVDTDGNNLDQVLFLVMHAPRTFTGQDTVEITCHNNPFIIESIIQQALLHGARVAREVEFSRRAVQNNKIDILQAEAIKDLIHANTSVALKSSMAQLEGSLSAWSQHIEKGLLKALAYCEASFEYLDEEMEFASDVQKILETLVADIETMNVQFNQQEQIRQGIRIVIIGAVNAGKSSLFNALLKKDRSIVTEVPGTTRDTVEAGLYRNGNYWTLVDTAGLRQTDDMIEQIGIDRAMNEAKTADVVVLVYDGSRAMTLEEHAVYADLHQKYAGKIIVVRNKSDLPRMQQTLLSADEYTCSRASKTAVDAIESAIQEKIKQLLSTCNAPYLLNQRQMHELQTLKKHIEQILAMLSDDTNVQYELLAVHIKDALQIISSLTGKSISEQGMDTIFREFCVGK